VDPSDLRATTRATIVDGTTFVVEGTFTGTHEGPLLTETGEIPPSRRPFTFRGASVGRLDGQGRIVEERRYYDLAGLFAQLQVAP
jgi:predicted ester cyclase